MYRILIADDEAIIREGIKCLFDYEALGFTICAEAANGEQAYEQITHLQPDVALMDIRMPGMSGLDVVKKARAQGYNGRVVIISSYTDFKFAQEAIRCGVQHYITKPIDEDELEQILRDFREDMDRERAAQSTSRHYRQKAHDSIIRDILLGRAELSRLNPADLYLDASTYQVILTERCRGGTADIIGPIAQMLQISDPCSSGCNLVTLADHDVFLLKGETALRRFHEFLERRQFGSRPKERNPADSLFITYGQQVSRLEEVSLSYRQARRLQDRRFFCDQNQHILSCEELPAFENTGPVISNELIKKYSAILLDCIHSFNRRMMAETLKELQELLYNSSDSIESIKLFLTDLYLQVKERMHHLYPNDEIPFLTNAAIIRSIDQADYLYEIILFFSKRFEVYMTATGTSTRDSVLDDILHYIHHNYASNITLENIAPLFGYNRSYLGKIFSKKMGQTFNSYVDHVRIERSKELLLKDEAKVYSIAERVGYKNVDYFHIKFKKYVGQSPAEFRKKNKKQSTSCSPAQGNTEKGPLF